jgi:hypothetical protein
MFEPNPKLKTANSEIGGSVRRVRGGLYAAVSPPGDTG